MSGLPGWDTSVGFFDGWYEQAAGIATLRFSIDDEGFLTASTDTPANTPFLARIVNAKDFYIARRPKVWIEGDAGGDEGSIAATGTLEIEDPMGVLNYLIGADIRDAVVTFQLPLAGAAGTLAGAPTVATLVIDDIKENPSTKNKILTFKDTLAKFDKPLRCRRIPSFMDAGAAKRIVPMTFGACRNVAPLLIDSPNRLYLLHDGQITNVAVVRDQYTPLDPHAAPPQYTPALNGSGLQLASDAFGKITVDCSSEGAQVVIPGADDVLGGIGNFATWSGTAPSGWSWSANAGSALTKLGIAQGYSQNYIASIGSTRPWLPLTGLYGDYLSLTSLTPLTGGRSYRINFKIWQSFGAAPNINGGNPAGIMLRTALSNNPADAITPHGQALTVRLAGNNSYTFTYSVPAGAARNIYLIGVSAQGPGSTGMGLGGGIIYNVAIEEIGQFEELPLTGITLGDYFKEVLVDRCGEIGAYEPTDLATLDDPAVAGYTFGIHFDEQPNILQDMLLPPLDSFGAALFTDATGKMRVRRLVAPENATIVAAFNYGCVDPDTIFKRAFNADALTTQMGSTRNWSPGTDGEFVTDTDVVSMETKARYMRVSQYLRTSSKNPAQEYAHAVGAPPFDSMLEYSENAQTEIDRMVGILSPRIVGGLALTGKAMLVDFDVYYENQTLGIGPSVAPQDLLYGDGVTLDTTDANGLNVEGFDTTAMVVVGTKFYPYAQMITITALYSDNGEA